MMTWPVFYLPQQISFPNKLFSLPTNSTVVGSRKSLSPRIKSSNDDFYTNRRGDKFSITYPKSAEIYFGEKYLSLFKKNIFCWESSQFTNISDGPPTFKHASGVRRFIACAEVVLNVETHDASKASV